MSADSHSSTRRDVEFDADGTTLRGWFHPAPDSAPTAAVVMAHGFSLVKEAYLTATRAVRRRRACGDFTIDVTGVT
ncbi:hypothetical protein AN217_19300 [Streptomyces qinglanensis]|uniref:Alpha/beta hydrolase n=1 Tax=Streptomyces qinglanensis TaxID=943816 RepID=A0A1E7K6Y6_9ACTN|nr:hypothetical protein [Streptomyces qinglanensis]OEU99606.1 hypothetical protein AN217_19300 [Streptomyces qinglanensis]OEV23592.1 hypothetical protein AN220_23410 [Streptomyces nanshensis]